ncbi:class B sortase [Staphylococcus auricularis]|uniref:class B sortase n=1 Tax=Staphylococcus auricularis TaxID=29379 RepID=UPI003C6F741C
MLKTLIRICQVLLIVVIVWSGYKMFSTYQQDKKAEARYTELQRKYTTIQTGTKEVRPQFEQLEQHNEDIIGWINLPGTPLNYPILQGEDNKEYLHEDFEHEESRKGSVFMDYRNDVANPSYNTVIYGHHVGDGSMFDTVEKYLDQSFYDQHPTLQYDTKYGKYQLEVLSAYQTTTEDYYIQTDFDNEAAYDQFLKQTMKKSQINTNTTVDKSDKIVTLSTCEDAFRPTSGRIVVVAKLVEAHE